MPGKLNLKRAKQEQKEIEEQTGKRRWLKTQVGPNPLRLLPPWKGDWPFYVGAQHRFSDKISLMCGHDRHGEGHCWTCDDAIPTLLKGNEKDQQLAYNIRPQVRIVANVLARNEEDLGCQLWGFSKTHYNTLLSYISDSDYGDITDPKTGRDFNFKRTGTGKEGTSYDIIMGGKPSPLNNDAVLNDLYDLDEACSGPPVMEVKRMFQNAFGFLPDANGDDEEPEEEFSPEADEGFDFDETVEASEEEEMQEESSEEASDSDLVPITAPSKLKGKALELYMEKAQEKSPCFGKKFDENADACATECDAVVECMTQFSS